MNSPGWRKKLKDIHFRPSEFYQEIDSESFSEPSRFVASTGLLFGLILFSLGLIGSLTTEATATSIIGLFGISFILIPIALLMGAFIQSFLVHIAVYVFGKRGLDKTYNAVAYPVTAVLIWGWIPLLNIFASIYSIYLQTRGISILHDMSTGKALVAVIWPILLSVVLTFFAIFAMLAGFAVA